VKGLGQVSGASVILGTVVDQGHYGADVGVTPPEGQVSGQQMLGVPLGFGEEGIPRFALYGRDHPLNHARFDRDLDPVGDGVRGLVSQFHAGDGHVDLDDLEAVSQGDDGVAGLVVGAAQSVDLFVSA
jgi:hypothetical protein